MVSTKTVNVTLAKMSTAVKKKKSSRQIIRDQIKYRT